MLDCDGDNLRTQTQPAASQRLVQIAELRRAVRWRNEAGPVGALTTTKRPAPAIATWSVPPSAELQAIGSEGRLGLSGSAATTTTNTTNATTSTPPMLPTHVMVSSRPASTSSCVASRYRKGVQDASCSEVSAKSAQLVIIDMTTVHHSTVPHVPVEACRPTDGRWVTVTKMARHTITPKGSATEERRKDRAVRCSARKERALVRTVRRALTVGDLPEIRFDLWRPALH